MRRPRGELQQEPSPIAPDGWRLFELHFPSRTGQGRGAGHFAFAVPLPGVQGEGPDGQPARAGPMRGKFLTHHPSSVPETGK